MMRLNSRDMARAMQRFGIQQQELPAVRVIIECEGKRIIIDKPSVAKVNLMGQETFQVTGAAREEACELAISSDDIKTVAETARVNSEVAKKALETAGGDLAQAILSLQKPVE